MNQMNNELSDIQLAIINHLHFTKKVSESTYVSNHPAPGVVRSSGGMTFHGQLKHEMHIMSAAAPGGAWYSSGKMFIEDEKTILEIRSVKSVIRRITDKETYTYYHCDPEFPDNLISMLEKVAINHIRAEKISNSRMWGKFYRKNRQLRITS